MAHTTPRTEDTVPRYKFVDGSGSKFWEVKLEGKTLLTRHGRSGSAGQVTHKALASLSAARKECDKLVASKLKKGYRQVGGAVAAASAAPATNPDLEAALLQNPDDDETYMVYADWLQTRGDPRGELAAIQQQLAASPKSAALKKKEAALLEQHRDHLLGDLASLPDEMLVDVEWHMGFIRKATRSSTCPWAPWATRGSSRWWTTPRASSTSSSSTCRTTTSPTRA